MYRNLFVCLVACLTTVAWHGQLTAQSDSLPPRVDIPSTQLLTFTSSIVGQEYQLFIHLPGSYQVDKGKAYPVVYLLDGQYDFPFLTGVYGGQYYDGFLPELIIVGITWGGKNPDAGSLRGRDFTPTRIEGMPQSGGGPKFLAFIKEELIPFISSKYRVANDRTLAGSSLGGLFTLYTLFNEPSLFHRYVLTSPALGWDNSVLRQHEKKFLASGISTPIRLFIAVGDLEGNVPEFEQFVERIKQNKIKGLELQTMILRNTGHAGTKPEGFARGLQFVFERPSLMLAAGILNRYSGNYQVGNDTVRLSAEKGRLVAITPGGDKIVLEAETENDFYLKGQFLRIHFKKEEGEKVSGFQVVQFQNELFARKLN